MKRMTLKNKLIAGSLAMILFVMVSSTVVVSIMVARQNQATSFTMVSRALTVIESDLADQRERLQDQAYQASTSNEMGSFVSLIHETASRGGDARSALTFEYETVASTVY